LVSWSVLIGGWLNGSTCERSRVTRATGCWGSCGARRGRWWRGGERRSG